MLEITTLFPKAIDCITEHLGPPETTIVSELADDRYYEIKVTRCGHCGIPLDEDYATSEEVEALRHE